MSKIAFSLRLQDEERAHGKRVANEPLMNKLRDLAMNTTKEDALAVLDKVPGAPPAPTDVY